MRQLQGRLIEIHGQVKEYDGRSEMTLEQYRQPGGTGASIPSLPKNYDVDKEGPLQHGNTQPSQGRKTGLQEVTTSKVGG